jgi:hypothetical protein
MNFQFTKINSLTYKGFELYYKKNIDTTIRNATVFNDKYIYYYCYPDEENKKLLGKYVGTGKINFGYRCNDVDYEILRFENDYVLRSKSAYIFCYMVSDSDSDSDSDMILIDNDFTFEGFPVFYKKT